LSSSLGVVALSLVDSFAVVDSSGLPTNLKFLTGYHNPQEIQRKRKRKPKTWPDHAQTRT